MNGINADLSTFAVADTAAMDWQPSPAAGVWRKRLDHIGPEEGGRVTSIVRYDPGSTFAAHDHPDGEEIFVLEGTFSDEHGDYPAGTYLLNPEGFRHAPFTRDGCVLFVKLRQYAGAGRQHVNVDARAMPWAPGPMPGIAVKELYCQDGFADRTYLFRVDGGLSFPAHEHDGGEELFFLEGDLEDEHGRYGPGYWVRYPVGSGHAPRTEGGCLFYVKVGGLVASATPAQAQASSA